MHEGIVSLWSLLEACRVVDVDARRHAANAVAAAVRQSARGRASIELTLVGGSLTWDGATVARGIESFAALHGVAATLRAAGVTGVRIGADVTADDLERWAMQLAEGGPCDVWVASLEPIQEVSEPAVVESARSGSRLGAMFLMHRLVAALPHVPGVDLAVSRLIVQGVVDRLQQLPSGLEPLMVLQQDEALLQRARRSAVLTVLFARAAGWPTERLCELGAVALLHDVGSALDPVDPGLAGFRWLLERGEHDFWLRSALVARRWPSDFTPFGVSVGGEPLAVVALVRLAVAAGEEQDSGARVRRMRALGVSGAVPLALVTAALEVWPAA